MNLKHLLFGSAAALATATGAHAADAIVAAQPEAVEYVRICDAYGAGYFYIPGTETCLRVGGRVRTEGLFGSPYQAGVYAGGVTWHTRAELALDTATDTEYGPLKTNMIYRFDWQDGGATTTKILFANISLGGFMVGKFDSQFDYYIGYAGNVIDDDVIAYGTKELNQLTYTYDAGNGFTAVASLEDSNSAYGDTYRFSSGDNNWRTGEAHHWLPDVVAGLGYKTGMFGFKLVGGYDSIVEEGAIKARIDANLGAFKAFLMGGYNTDGNKLNKYADTNFSDRGASTLCPVDRRDLCGWGDWAVWGGFTYDFTNKLETNAQVAYTDSKIFSASLNLAVKPVSNLTITPEVNYTHWDSVDAHAWTGVVRFERKF